MVKVADEPGLEAWGKRWNKKVHADVVFDPADEQLVPHAISIGIPALDIMLGGGIPRGRTTIVYGEYSSGKTLLTQFIIAAAQRQGGKAIFFDVERTFDPRWFEATGVSLDKNKLKVARPRNLEQCFDMVVDALENLRPDVIVVDSIPAMVPSAMMRDKRGKLVEMAEKDFRGLAARKMTEGVAKATAYNQTSALIFVNQVRVDMGVTFGSPDKMPGGKGLGFHASIIIRMRKGGWLTTETEKGEADLSSFVKVDKEETPRIGCMLKMRTEKNKIAPPMQRCEFKFFFTGEVDPTGSLVHLAVTRGVISENKGYYVVPGIKGKIHGRRQLEARIKSDAELERMLIEGVQEVV